MIIIIPLTLAIIVIIILMMMIMMIIVKMLLNIEYCRGKYNREHPPPANPGHLKKLFKCPAMRAIFVGKCPTPRSFCGGQMPGPPVHPINIQSYWLPYIKT